MYDSIDPGFDNVDDTTNRDGNNYQEDNDDDSGANWEIVIFTDINIDVKYHPKINQWVNPNQKQKEEGFICISGRFGICLPTNKIRDIINTA